MVHTYQKLVLVNVLIIWFFHDDGPSSPNKTFLKYEMSHPEFEGENFVKLVDTSYKLLDCKKVN